ncbi:MAG: hypothetical protein WCQ89_08760 [Verrucomicrobiota bacterium]
MIPSQRTKPHSCPATSPTRWAGLLLAIPLLGAVLTAEAATPAAKADEAVKLSAFEVSSNRVGPYQVSDSTSGGRLRTDIFESTQGISVITRELFRTWVRPTR